MRSDIETFRHSVESSPYLAMVTLDRERRLCQGREAPEGPGLDRVGVYDTLHRAK